MKRKNHKIHKDCVVFIAISMAFCDLDWIQTSNLLSRNQVRYSVAPRGRFIGMQIYYIN